MSQTLDSQDSQDYDYEGFDSSPDTDLEESSEDECAPPTLRKYERSLRWWREYAHRIQRIVSI